MNYTLCIGGLKYNIDSLTEEFYTYHAKQFECPFDENSYHIVVTKEALDSYPFSNPELDLYSNETFYLLERVIRHCLDYNRMIIHGAAISYDNNAFIFIAPSKTGKSTHIGLWEKYLQDKVTIINGDKPMLEFGESIIVHGTPWNGKENKGTNISVPLKGIVVLKQDEHNSFRKLDTNESITNLMVNCFYSIDKESGPKVVKYIAELVNRVSIYELKCNISKEAFDTCFEGLQSNI